MMSELPEVETIKKRVYLKKLAACNRELKDTEFLDRIHATSQLMAIGENNGFMPCFSSDPRGATVKLKVPSGKTNDWGEVGVCVPTRSY